MTLSKRLEEIKKRLEAASKGPWYWNGCAGVWEGTSMDDAGRFITSTWHEEYAMPEEATDNAKLFAHSRTDLEFLSAALEKAVGALKHAKKFCESGAVERSRDPETDLSEILDAAMAEIERLAGEKP